MKDEIIVKRYAEAFVGFAKETPGLEKALEDFLNIKNILRDNPDFLGLLENPAVAYAEKCAFIDQVLTEGFSQETRQFLKLLVEKERVDKLGDIAEFLRMHYAHSGAKTVVLRTAFPLDLELIKEIEDRLEKKYNSKFKFYINLDASLLGGLKVEMGHRWLDGTVRKGLEELRKNLMRLKV